MIAASARLLAGVENCFVGVGLPNIVCNLAQRTVAPELQLVYESGRVRGPAPTAAAVDRRSDAGQRLHRRSPRMFELFAFYLQAGLIDVAFLGGAQIDRFGNLNTTVIGDYDRPKVRLPGSGGACEIAIHARKILVIMRQAERSFVEKLDFRTSPGHSGDPAHDRGARLVGERSDERRDGPRHLRLRRGDRRDDAAHDASGRHPRGRSGRAWRGSRASRRISPRHRRRPTTSSGSSARSSTRDASTRSSLGSVSHVFSRATRDLPTAVSAEGAWITDADGTRYLDGAGGAIVVNVGHGVASVIAAIGEQLERTQYVHPTAFTTRAVEAYADEVAAILPMDDARIYPVSGGSEAVETAIKMARAYHLAKGQGGRSIVIGRRNSYHGNSLGALDASGKAPLRKPYTPWLGRSLHVSAAYEFRCENPQHPHGCGAWQAAELEKMIASYGEDTIAAFIAEPVAGATLGAAVPADDYWPSIAEVCRRHDVVLIADEVMTGFGRTGRWFGMDHWDVRPDILTAGKGTTSGYVPFGFAAASGRVHETIAAGPGFVHGFTWSHNALGAAAGLRGPR